MPDKLQALNRKPAGAADGTKGFCVFTDQIEGLAPADPPATEAALAPVAAVAVAPEMEQTKSQVGIPPLRACS